MEVEPIDSFLNFDVINSHIDLIKNWKKASNESLEESGCMIWDASTNQSIALYIFNKAIFSSLLKILVEEKSDRIKEISFGLISNMMSVKDIGTSMIDNDDLIACTFNAIFSKDPGTLTEISRLLQVILFYPPNEKWKSKFEFVPILQRIIYIFAGTLDESLCANIATFLINLISCYDEEILNILITDLNFIDILTEVLIERIKQEKTDESFNYSDEVIENIVNLIEFISTKEISFPTICSEKLRKNLSKLIQKQDEIKVIISACLALANIETEDKDSILYQDYKLIKSLIFHLKIYCKMHDVTAIIALLFEITQKLKINFSTKSVKVFENNIDGIVESLNEVPKEEFVINFLQNLLDLFSTSNGSNISDEQKESIEFFIGNS